MRSKKIVFVTDSGFWSHNTDLLKELNQLNDMYVLITFVKGFSNHDKNDIVNFCVLNKIKFELVDKDNIRSRSLRNIFHSYRKYISKIKVFNPDIIYIESFSNPYLAIMYRLFFDVQKIVMGVHDFKLHPLGNKKTKFSARVYREIYTKLFLNFHFFSESQKDLFVKKHPNKRVFVARLYLLDIEKNNYESARSTRTFLYFGRILYYKGVDVLIKAANILTDQKIDFNLVIAGYSENFDYYSSMLKNNPNVETKIYKITKEELDKIFLNSNYFVAPYREVTQSGPLIISYNYKMIPIASDLNGFKEYIENGKTGFLFENENPISLAKCMKDILDLSDIQKNEIHSNIQKFKDKEFNIKSIAKSYLEFFESIL